jgi:hypothetical protein
MARLSFNGLKHTALSGALSGYRNHQRYLIRASMGLTYHRAMQWDHRLKVLK